MCYPVIPITCDVLRPSNCPLGSTVTTFMGVMAHGDMKAARLMLSLGALLWAAFLLWPYYLGIQLFPNAEQIASGVGRTTYSVMAQIADAWIWATLFGLHGIFLFVSVFYKVHPGAALLDAFNGAAIWTCATAACYLAHFKGWGSFMPPAAMGMDVAAVFASWWWFVRVLANPRYEADN